MSVDAICLVEVTPDVVDAGAEACITVRVLGAEQREVLERTLSIRNADGVDVANAALMIGGGPEVVTTLIIRAPLTIGAHAYRAVLSADVRHGASFEEISTAFSIVVKAHAVDVSVWGMPSAIPAGERFSFNVGIKCSAGCKLSGLNLRVIDHEGADVGAGTLNDECWPATEALYFAEVEAVAPTTQGDYQWHVSTGGSDGGTPHAGGSSTFVIKVVDTPDHVVTVEAFDRQTQAPIKGAHVLLRPYRAFTNDDGTAMLNVADGSYKLFVSGFNYVGYETTIEVTRDVTLRVDLAVEPEGLEDYR